MSIIDVFKSAYHTLLFVPILNLLILFYHLMWDNLGLAIIGMTIFIRIILWPLTNKQIDAARKQKEMQPQLAQLKKKYKNKEVFAKKQMELMRENGVNPATGCVTMIIPILIIFPLYRVFTYLLDSGGVGIARVNEYLYFDFLKFAEDAVLNTQFLYLDLAKPDQYFILPILAALSQFFLSKYMMGSNKKAQELAKNTPDQKDDIMAGMQSQMTYIMPIITLIIGYKLPSGLVLYWFISTFAMLAQYVFINKKEDKKKAESSTSQKVKDAEQRVEDENKAEIIDGEIIEDDGGTSTDNNPPKDNSKKKKKKKKKKK